jgi:hypothetical protein
LIDWYFSLKPFLFNWCILPTLLIADQMLTAGPKSHLGEDHSGGQDLANAGHGDARALVGGAELSAAYDLQSSWQGVYRYVIFH